MPDTEIINIITTETARKIIGSWTIEYDRTPNTLPVDISKMSPDEIADAVVEKLKKHPKSLTDIRTDSIMDVMAKQIQIEIDKEILEKIKQLGDLK